MAHGWHLIVNYRRKRSMQQCLPGHGPAVVGAVEPAPADAIPLRRLLRLQGCRGRRAAGLLPAARDAVRQQQRQHQAQQEGRQRHQDLALEAHQLQGGWHAHGLRRHPSAPHCGQWCSSSSQHQIAGYSAPVISSAA